MERTPIVSDADIRPLAFEEAAIKWSECGGPRDHQHDCECPAFEWGAAHGAKTVRDIYEQHLASSLPTIDQVMDVLKRSDAWATLRRVLLDDEHAEVDLRTRLSSILPQGWVSVEERLPNKQIPVHIQHADGTTGLGTYGRFRGADRWTFEHEPLTTSHDGSTITHWMPFPDPCLLSPPINTDKG